MTRYPIKPGPDDRLTDLAGLKVGNACDERAKTGTTVIVPDQAVIMAVDIRGGGPGTRDTDALDPTCLVDHFHGLVLSGGSVFGLAAADGVVSALSESGIGLALGARAVPVVPAAILFDLANGGDKDWGARAPYFALGQTALANAARDFETGRAGAGFGALAGAQAGGLCTASAFAQNGLMVGALVAVNSFGALIDRAAGEDLSAIDFPKMGLTAGNTTIAAVATNMTLDKAGAKRLAMMAQDGLARAIRPIHTPYDGDSVFAISTESWGADATDPTLLALAGTMAADAIVRAVGKLACR